MRAHDDPPFIDLTGAFERAAGDKEFVVAIVEAILSDVAGRSESAKSALDSGDLTKLALEAHTLKSMAHHAGSNRLLATCKRVEDAARGGDETCLADLTQEMVANVEGVVDALQQWLASDNA